VSDQQADATDQEARTHPDYRFSLANERTFLAWVRTSLALLAAGIAVVDLPANFSTRTGRHLLGLVLIILSLLAAGGSYLRWHRNDAAIRSGKPLQASQAMPVIALGLTLVALLALVMVIVDL
jgi:putative membrane protein